MKHIVKLQENNKAMHYIVDNEKTQHAVGGGEFAELIDSIIEDFYYGVEDELELIIQRPRLF